MTRAQIDYLAELAMSSPDEIAAVLALETVALISMISRTSRGDALPDGGLTPELADW